MSPVSRRAFLGSLAAIPIIGRFFPKPLTFSGECCVDCIRQSAPTLLGGELSGVRITPVIMGIVPRDWLKLPYYRVLNGGVGHALLITSHDQDPEFETSEVIPRRSI